MQCNMAVSFRGCIALPLLRGSCPIRLTLLCKHLLASSSLLHSLHSSIVVVLGYTTFLHYPPFFSVLPYIVLPSLVPVVTYIPSFLQLLIKPLLNIPDTVGIGQDFLGQCLSLARGLQREHRSELNGKSGLRRLNITHSVSGCMALPMCSPDIPGACL